MYSHRTARQDKDDAVNCTSSPFAPGSDFERVQPKWDGCYLYGSCSQSGGTVRRVILPSSPHLNHQPCFRSASLRPHICSPHHPTYTLHYPSAVLSLATAQPLIFSHWAARNSSVGPDFRGRVPFEGCTPEEKQPTREVASGCCSQLRYRGNHLAHELRNKV